MAMYSAILTVPRNTPESSPVNALITPLNGLVKTIEIVFPAGAAGAVGIRIFDEGRQFAPLPAGWLFGNDKVKKWVENRRLQGPPYRVIIQGYSRAIDWPHTISIEMEIV